MSKNEKKDAEAKDAEAEESKDDDKAEDSKDDKAEDPKDDAKAKDSKDDAKAKESKSDAKAKESTDDEAESGQREKKKDRKRSSDKKKSRDRKQSRDKKKAKKAAREATSDPPPKKAKPSKAAHAAPGHHKPDRKEYVRIWAILGALTVLEVGVAYTQDYVGKTALVIALVGLALTKAAIVAMFFMHLKHETSNMRFTVAFPMAFPALYALILIAEGIYRAL